MGAAGRPAMSLAGYVTEESTLPGCFSGGEEPMRADEKDKY